MEENQVSRPGSPNQEVETPIQFKTVLNAIHSANDFDGLLSNLREIEENENVKNSS